MADRSPSRQLAFALPLRRYIQCLQRLRWPTNTDGHVGSAIAFQAHPEARLFADEHGTAGTGLEDQAGKVAIGVQNRHHEHGGKQKGQTVGEAVLVVDAGQQHQQQHQGKSGTDPVGHDEDAPLVQLHLGRSGNPPHHPAPPAGLERQRQHYTAETSRSSHCTNAPPPWPAGSARSRRR